MGHSSSAGPGAGGPGGPIRPVAISGQGASSTILHTLSSTAPLQRKMTKLVWLIWIKVVHGNFSLNGAEFGETMVGGLLGKRLGRPQTHQEKGLKTSDVVPDRSHKDCLQGKQDVGPDHE